MVNGERYQGKRAAIEERLEADRKRDEKQKRTVEPELSEYVNETEQKRVDPDCQKAMELEKYYLSSSKNFCGGKTRVNDSLSGWLTGATRKQGTCG